MIAPAPSEPDRSWPRPAWIDDDLVAETQAVWSPFYGHALTEAEAVEILVNMGRLLDALGEKPS